VTEATKETANDTTLVVYREDRYCPATSQLPQDYQRRIESRRGRGQRDPVKVVVSNCRTSLDVVTFRGVPKDAFLADRQTRSRSSRARSRTGRGGPTPRCRARPSPNGAGCAPA
jgi:hypothetical protein